MSRVYGFYTVEKLIKALSDFPKDLVVLVDSDGRIERDVCLAEQFANLEEHANTETVEYVYLEVSDKEKDGYEKVLVIS